MSIVDKIDDYLKESDSETWVCDECGWEGPKSALKDGNVCPKCGAKPPEVHVKKEVSEAKIGDAFTLESDKDFIKDLRIIEKLTNKNDHNGARIAAAELVNRIGQKNIKFINLYKLIDNIYKIEKNMPSELLKYRDKVDIDFYMFAESVLDEKTFVIIRGSL